MWRGMQRLTDIQLGYELALNRSVDLPLYFRTPPHT